MKNKLNLQKQKKLKNKKNCPFVFIDESDSFFMCTPGSCSWSASMSLCRAQTSAWVYGIGPQHTKTERAVAIEGHVACEVRFVRGGHVLNAQKRVVMHISTQAFDSYSSHMYFIVDAHVVLVLFLYMLFLLVFILF